MSGRARGGRDLTGRHNSRKKEAMYLFESSGALVVSVLIYVFGVRQALERASRT